MNVFAFNTSKLYWSSKSYTDLLICLESQPSWSLGNEFIIFSPEKEMYYQIVGRNNQCSRADLHIPLLSYFPCDNTSTQSHLFITLQSFLECYYLNAPGIPANPVRHPQSVVQFINVYPNSLLVFIFLFFCYMNIRAKMLAQTLTHVCLTDEAIESQRFFSFSSFTSFWMCASNMY